MTFPKSQKLKPSRSIARLHSLALGALIGLATISCLGSPASILPPTPTPAPLLSYATVTPNIPQRSTGFGPRQTATLAKPATSPTAGISAPIPVGNATETVQRPRWLAITAVATITRSALPGAPVQSPAPQETTPPPIVQPPAPQAIATSTPRTAAPAPPATQPAAPPSVTPTPTTPPKAPTPAPTILPVTPPTSYPLPPAAGTQAEAPTPAPPVGYPIK